MATKKISRIYTIRKTSVFSVFSVTCGPLPTAENQKLRNLDKKKKKRMSDS